MTTATTSRVTVFTLRLPDGRPAESVGLWVDPRTNETMIVCRAKDDPMLTVIHPSNVERVSPSGAVRKTSDTTRTFLRRFADPRWRGDQE